MPTNLVKSKQDEADWAEARRIVDKQYPDKSPDDKDKSYWKLTTSIYENIKKNRGKKQMQKQASVGELLARQIRLRKQADGGKRDSDYAAWRGKINEPDPALISLPPKNWTPNNPMADERIQRLVKGKKAPRSVWEIARPIADSEIPLPEDDPGAVAPPNKAKAALKQ